MSVKNCLLIGGAGFIGTHLSLALLDSGWNVTVLSRSRIDESRQIKGCIYVSGDFADPIILEYLLDANELIIHLAYATVPNTSFDNPVSDLQQNLPPTVQLFHEVAKRSKRLIYVSSGGTVYGEPSSLPISEAHVTNPISPYGLTKLTLEKYANFYRVAHGLKVICIRPSNPYGPGQRPFTGQGFVSYAIGSILKGQSVKVFGKHGTVRDYIYIDDLVAGIIEVVLTGHEGETYNIGSSVGMTNLQILNRLSPLIEILGRSVTIEHLPERVFDVTANVLDCQKLIGHSDWVVKTSLQEGLSKTVTWLKNQSF